MSEAERTVEELKAMGLVEECGQDDEGNPRVRLTPDGKGRVEEMLDACLEDAVTAFATHVNVPHWMARDMLFKRAEYLRGLDG